VKNEMMSFFLGLIAGVFVGLSVYLSLKDSKYSSLAYAAGIITLWIVWGLWWIGEILKQILEKLPAAL
jgi:hypothetical protein